MTVLRACVRCGRPSRESYCTKHKPKPWATSRRKEPVGLSGSAEQARRERILERYLYCCHVCGKTGADEVDHRIPLGEGAADEDWNLAPIHSEPCHREKTAAEARRARA
jgi:5-methylcytosine-specific restriction protein A